MALELRHPGSSIAPANLHSLLVLTSGTRMTFNPISKGNNVLVLKRTVYQNIGGDFF